MTTCKLAMVGVLAVTVMGGCKKTGTTGGGGGWFVGESGLMVNLDPDESPDELTEYSLETEQSLRAIACRHRAEAWVAGAQGTLLYTSDGGQAWSTKTLPTNADLHGVATEDEGAVFLVGDGVFLTSVPDATGDAAWTVIEGARFTSVSASRNAGAAAATVLAIDDAGDVWSYANGSLVKRSHVDGASTIAVAADGQRAIAAGHGLSRSSDGGVTWTSLEVDPSIVWEDVRFDRRGDAVAVGSGGAVARIDVDGRVLLQRVGDADLTTLHVAPTDDYSGVGFAAGRGGPIWITYDAGWTWESGPTVSGNVLAVDELGEGHR